MRTTHALPQVRGELMITDGGLETDLIFHRGIDLPQFAAFPLVADEAGRDVLRAYYADYADIARGHGAGLVLESPTWRANPDWAGLLGYGARELDAINREAARFMAELRDTTAADVASVVVSGQIGPRGDGYVVGEAMDAAAARAYHAPQVAALAAGGADMVAALTMNYVDEAVGIVQAASDAGVPAAISFTVETDGRLPDGTDLGAAIMAVDDRTDGGAAYFMINCAHPSHFAGALESGGEWTARIMGLRANASQLSHAELDEAEELDEGDPADLAARHRDLRGVLPNVAVLGGCCGTDHRHVAHVAAAWRGD